MGTYEVWRALMYAVGVFVTCNVGGLALLEGVRRLTRRKVRVVSAEELAQRLSEQWETAQGHSGERQTFEDIRRQVDGPTPKAESADGMESAKTASEEKDFFSD